MNSKEPEIGIGDLSDERFDFLGRRMTGEPAFASLAVAELAARARREPIETQQLQLARTTLRRMKTHRSVIIEGVDASRPEQAGWGVVFPEHGNPEIREALDPLIRWRQAQVEEVDKRRFRELAGEQGYQSDDTRIDFLRRQKASYDVVDPRQFPYYLLLVGSPEEIPFAFQSQLDLQHGVGRLDFETPDEYAAYAIGVVEAEKDHAMPSRIRRAVFFCPTNEIVAERIGRELVGTLVERFEAEPVRGWKVEAILGEEATRQRLLNLLEGADKPDLLFTAGHGVSCEAEDVAQREQQGGLWCHDRPVVAADLGSRPRSQGLITFHFACFGAGTDRWDEFETKDDGSPLIRADKPFTARLPQVLLRGGALAALGHVGRTWTSSFSRKNDTLGADQAQENLLQLGAFETTLRRILQGAPVGHALEPFNERYAQMTAELAYLNNVNKLGASTSRQHAEAFRSYLDARNFIVLGDPAVRLLPMIAPEAPQ